MASKIHLERTIHPPSPLIKTLKPVGRILIRDRQVYVLRLAYELPIPTTAVYEIMSNHLGMKKISTRWVAKLLTPIQHANRVNCCHELLENREINPDNYFDRTVTGDETWVYYYDRLSQQETKVWKKAGEETPT